jgi:predicted aminopeptidase
MMSYDEDDLVNLIIHETTHTTLYIKSSADFNEQLATFVGNKGTEQYYEKLEGKNSKTLKKIKLKNEDEKIFTIFITTEIPQLDSWKKTKPAKNKKQKKQTRLSNIQENFKKLKFKTLGYEYFKKMKLNNAILLGYKTYVNDLSKFERVYEKNKDMKSFIQSVKTLESSKDPEKDLQKL